MDNIISCLLIWINEKGYYYQSYGKNHRVTVIDILVDNFGGHNKDNAMIRSLNTIKEGGFFGTSTFNFYIKGHTKDCDRAFKNT